MGNVGIRNLGQGRVGGDDDGGDADEIGNDAGEGQIEGEPCSIFIIISMLNQYYLQLCLCSRRGRRERKRRLEEK